MIMVNTDIMGTMGTMGIMEVKDGKGVIQHTHLVLEGAKECNSNFDIAFLFD